MRSAVAFVVLIAGCDWAYDLTGRTEDASVGDAAPPDAPCELGPFSSDVVLLAELQVQGTYDPALSADGLELYYAQVETHQHIKRAARSAPGAPWTLDGVVPALDSNFDDLDPTITADGLTLLFISTRDAQQFPYNVYETSRSSRSEAWGVPTRVAGIDVNARSIDVSPDGKTLYVMEDDTAQAMLYRFTRTSVGAPFEARARAGSGTRYPSIDASGTEIYYMDGIDIYRMYDPGIGFVSPELIARNLGDPDLSHDGRTLTAALTNGGIAQLVRTCVDQ